MTAAFFPTSPFRQLRGRVLDLARGTHARAVCRRPPGQGPLVVFMPAGPISDGAVRLRVHEVARALGRQGWRAAVLPWKLSLEVRRQVLARLAPDVLVMQGVRHPLNRPHLYPGRPIVMDIDDADFHLAHLAVAMEQAMRDVACVIAGSQYIADWAERRDTPAQVVWTGTPVSPLRTRNIPDRGPVVAWAQTRPATYVEEARTVRRVMAEVAAARPGAVLRLYDRHDGDGDGFAQSFEVPGLTVEWRPRMPYRRFLDSLRDVSVGLAPLSDETPFSKGKSFGKVLAYLDSGVACVASANCEHPRFFDGANGTLAYDDAGMAAATLRYLGNADLRRRTAETGRRALGAHLSSEAAARGVARVLDAIDSDGQKGCRRRNGDQRGRECFT